MNIREELLKDLHINCCYKHDLAADLFEGDVHILGITIAGLKKMGWNILNVEGRLDQGGRYHTIGYRISRTHFELIWRAFYRRPEKRPQKRVSLTPEGLKSWIQERTTVTTPRPPMRGTSPKHNPPNITPKIDG